MFEPAVPTLPKVTLLCYKWEMKRNVMNEIVRYVARLMAQGFSQMPCDSLHHYECD